MKLNTKIVITLLEIALIPWVIGGGLIFLSAQEQLNAKIYAELNAIASIQKDRLNAVLNDRQDLLTLFMTKPLLRSYLQTFNAEPTPMLQKNMNDNLAETASNSVSIKKIFVTNLAGTIVASTDRALLGTSVSAEDFFQRGIKHTDLSTLKKDRSTGILYHYLDGPLVLDGKILGMVALVTSADAIVGIARDYNGLGNTGETLLAKDDGKGNVLFLTPIRFDPLAALTRVVPKERVDIPSVHAIAGEEETFSNFVDYRDIPVFSSTRYVSSVGWGIVVKIDKSESMASMIKLRELFSLVIVVIGLLLILIGVGMSRSITRPVRALTLFVNKIEEGDLQQNITVASKDELGALGSAFNRMASKLQESYTTLEKRVAERTVELERKTKEARDSEKAALNITADLKQEEEKLANEKTKAENLANDLKKFKLALDNTSDQVIITDKEGTVMYANPAIEKITGYTPEEAIGKKSGALWEMPMTSEYYKAFWHTVKDEKKTFIGEVQNKRKNGEIYVAAISVSPVLDENGNILFFVGLERDVTKEREIDQAKSEFISLASHQMRTPLTAINWYAEMLLDEDSGKLNKKQRTYFDAIATAGRQMSEIIKSFLHILRLESGTLPINPVEIHLAESLKAIMKESQLDIDKKHLTIVEHYQESLSLLFVDEEIVHVVLQNLITNAVKYVPEQGKVTASIEQVKKGNLVGGKKINKDSLVVSVHNNGFSIPASDQDKIFSKFFRADAAKKWDPNGNGIGLYMSRKMMNIVKGDIWFLSEEGQGVTFYALFPLAKKG